MKKNTVYVVTASGMELFGYILESATYTSLHKTKESARKKFLLFIEKYYTKEVLDKIREEYPEDFTKMLEKEFYKSGYEAWSDDYDEEAQKNADFQLDYCTITVHDIEE